MTDDMEDHYASVSDLDWRQLAQCDASSAHLFTVHHRETKKEKRQRESSAKRLCRSCPVTAWCLDYALARGESDGIWGGLNSAEREAALTHQFSSAPARTA